MGAWSSPYLWLWSHYSTPRCVSDIVMLLNMQDFMVYCYLVLNYICCWIIWVTHQQKRKNTSLWRILLLLPIAPFPRYCVKQERKHVLDHLHSAHRDVTGMLTLAQVKMYWPGISIDIESKKQICLPCHRNALSQKRLPPELSLIQTVPFELIFEDSIKLKGKFFLLIGDRLSGWTDIV